MIPANVVSPVTLKLPSTLTFFSNVTSSLKETARPKEISLSNTRLPPNIKFPSTSTFFRKVTFSLNLDSLPNTCTAIFYSSAPITLPAIPTGLPAARPVVNPFDTNQSNPTLGSNTTSESSAMSSNPMTAF